MSVNKQPRPRGHRAHRAAHTKAPAQNKSETAQNKSAASQAWEAEAHSAPAEALEDQKTTLLYLPSLYSTLLYSLYYANTASAMPCTNLSISASVRSAGRAVPHMRLACCAH